MHIQWQPEMPWLIKGPHAGPTSGAGQTARLDVWLAEKIFDMRSDFDIWLMMKRLQPCLPIVARPSPPPRQALPADVPSAYRFSLAGLMCSMQSAGYAEAKQPAALKIELYAFQRQSLQWMLDQERSPGGMNAAFWEEHPLLALPAGRKSFFYNPTCGELMSNATMQDGRPPLTTGGFLCEGTPLPAPERPSHLRFPTCVCDSRQKWGWARRASCSLSSSPTHTTRRPRHTAYTTPRRTCSSTRRAPRL